MIRTKSILTKNECYAKGRKRSSTLGVLIHSTATPGASPDNFVRAWNVGRPNGSQVCVSAFLDNEKVIETLPLDWRSWGCGSGPKGSFNNSHVQVEICEPKGVYCDSRWEYHIKLGYELQVKKYIRQAFENAALWTASVLHELGINQVNKTTVTSHYEAHALGYASGHQDPKGYFGLIGKTMDDFRIRVSEILASGSFIGYNDAVDNTVKDDNSNSEVKKPDNSVENPVPVKVDYAKSFNKNYSRVYKVTAQSGLWMRTGAGTNKSKIACLPFGAKVRCYGYFTAVNNTPWLFVQYGKNTGFCCAAYLK